MHYMHSARGKLAEDLSGTRKERVKAIREALGYTQLTYLPVLNAASAAVLGVGVREYSQSTYSRIESGRQEPTFDDIAVFASLDPEHRGPLWLIWGDAAAAMFSAEKGKRARHPIPPGGVVVARNHTVHTPARRPSKPPRKS